MDAKTAEKKLAVSVRLPVRPPLIDTFDSRAHLQRIRMRYYSQDLRLTITTSQRYTRKEAWSLET